MKIGVIMGCDHETDHQLSMLGLTQAGYLIQLAFAWFNHANSLKVLNNTVIFTTQLAYDLEPAMLAANYPNMNYEIPMEMIDRRWGYCGDDLPKKKSKARNLAKQICEFERDCVMVFAYFYGSKKEESNIKPFLDYWSIDVPQAWPQGNQPSLIRIDTDSKTVEIDFAPYPPQRK